MYSTIGRVKAAIYPPKPRPGDRVAVPPALHPAHLAQGLGRELGPQGILANAIAPSFIDTPQLQVDASDAGLTLDEMRRVYAEQIPVRRLASPDDIAAAVAFLAGPGSSAVVGQILQPSGGVTRTRA
jgi:2-hydroxycyclohexanecarboxyl-CoA dehydrogenase